MNTRDIALKLVSRLEDPSLHGLGVMRWAAPIISFGDLSRSKVATLGLNPSNREFLDANGNELSGGARRFHTLNSLGLKAWSDADSSHLDAVVESCSDYFNRNPYDAWFKALEKLFLDAAVSYYGLFSNACHLDLVPYTTEIKWGSLSVSQRAGLLDSSGDVLGLLLRQSDVEVLVLNGQSVIANLQTIAECSFKRQPVQDWLLPRRNSGGVTGYAYTGTVRSISGVDLGREIAVLGYNHNLQSSFGVTAQVKEAIQKWISSRTLEAFC